MRSLVIAITGFLLGGALVTGAALAFTPSQTVTVKQTPIVSAMPMSGATMMSSAATAPGSQRLFIQHVMRGCHVWSNGKTQATTMRVALRTGGRLSILDQDIDAHQLVQLSGPMRLHLGGPMAMNHGTVVVFLKKGVYGFTTKTVEMPGMSAMDVKTIGPDNTLRLFVTVK